MNCCSGVKTDTIKLTRVSLRHPTQQSVRNSAPESVNRSPQTFSFPTRWSSLTPSWMLDHVSTVPTLCLSRPSGLIGSCNCHTRRQRSSSSALQRQTCSLLPFTSSPSCRPDSDSRCETTPSDCAVPGPTIPPCSGCKAAVPSPVLQLHGCAYILLSVHDFPSPLWLKAPGHVCINQQSRRTGTLV